MTVAEYKLNLIVVDDRRVFIKNDMRELSKKDAADALRIVGSNKKPLIDLDAPLYDYEVSLLDLLGADENAQFTVRSIATKLSISSGAVANRLYKLKRLGMVTRTRPAAGHGQSTPHLWQITEEGNKARSDD